MKAVVIEGKIGYDWIGDSGTTLKSVEEQLVGLAAGEDIKISINSPGGSCYEGFAIFNRIRELAKTHNVSVEIKCLACSIASYIAIAARSVDRAAKITVCENSVVMIHNPWGCVCGNYRKFRSMADYYEKLTGIYASAHVLVSGKDMQEILAAMDAESFYVGKEIYDYGFANDYEPLQSSSETGTAANDVFLHSRDSSIVNAKMVYDKSARKEYEIFIKHNDRYMVDIEKAVACLENTEIKTPVQLDGNKNNRGVAMKPEELLAHDKACYDAVFALGEKAGLDKERARVNAHLMLGEKAKALDISAKHIKTGVSTNDETAQAEYFAAQMDTHRIEARIGDNPAETKTGGVADDDVKLAAAFEAGMKGKDLEGKQWTA